MGHLFGVQLTQIVQQHTGVKHNLAASSVGSTTASSVGGINKYILQQTVADCPATYFVFVC